MKRKLVVGVIVFLVITNIIILRRNVLYKAKIDKQKFIVYSFEGEDKDVEISNGLVIISPKRQMLSGGEIRYKGSKLENIQSYFESIYLRKYGNKDVVISKSVSFTGNNKGMTFPDEFLLNKSVGEISSKKLFIADDINIIKDKLYFYWIIQKLMDKQETLQLN